ncbi:MAG: Ig-like domain-containing protein [Bacteroidales bacterium]|nr:Ig-like domain-containing protein [Bacteroidales bacterium]MCF8390997.1 Ig-like domain-containing protein [Bacteroidales bacterium]
MKTIKYLFVIMLIGSFIAFVGCSKDETPEALKIVSITGLGTGLETGLATTVDLNAITAADDVPLDVVITITFDKAVDASTANASNFNLNMGNDPVEISVVANAEVVTITPLNDLARGKGHQLILSADILADDGGAFTATSRVFSTEGIAEVVPPQQANMVVYIPFNNDAESTVGDITPVFEQLNYGSDRYGFPGSAGLFNGATAAGNGDIVEYEYNTAFLSPSMTVTTWFKINSADYSGSRFMFGLAVERGYFMELGSGSVAWMKFATNHMLDPDPKSHVYGVSWSDPNGDGVIGGQVLVDYLGSITDLVADDNWHQLAMTFDSNSSVKTIFIDGMVIMQLDIDSETLEWYLSDMAINEVGVESVIDKKFAIGYAGSRDNQATGWALYANAQNTFKGYLDDFRIFNVALTEAEISQLYNDEKN